MIHGGGGRGGGGLVTDIGAQVCSQHENNKASEWSWKVSLEFPSSKRSFAWHLTFSGWVFVFDRVSNAKIYDLTQTALLVENVRTRQLSFLGHVLRMPDDEPCKEYALYIPPHGKRKPGRQRTLFLRYIQHLLGDTDNMIGPGKLSELAQDRCGWRNLVAACSAADRWWRWWWFVFSTGHFRVPPASVSKRG